MMCLFALEAVKNWYLYQLNVNNTFLHRDLNEEAYMTIPPGYAQQGDYRVCRLKKSLNSLRQLLDNGFQNYLMQLLNIDFSKPSLITLYLSSH